MGGNMDFNKEIEDERKRYQEELAKLHKEQEKNSGMMLDDREQDLLAEHYRRMAEIGKKRREK